MENKYSLIKISKIKAKYTLCHGSLKYQEKENTTKRHICHILCQNVLHHTPTKSKKLYVGVRKKLTTATNSQLAHSVCQNANWENWCRLHVC